jgi:hypothetical protein
MKANLSREDIEDLKNQQGFDIVKSLEITLVNELKKAEFFRRLKDIKKSINKRWRPISGHIGHLKNRKFHNSIKRIKQKTKNKNE